MHLNTFDGRKCDKKVFKKFLWFVKHTKTFRVAVITLLTSFFKSVELLCGENRERLNCSIIRRCGLGVSGGGSW